MDDARDPAAPGGNPAAPAPPVGFLELFYDLVFVASTMVLSNTFSADASWTVGFEALLMFVFLWLLWFQTTTLTNVERVDDLGHRTLVLAQMFLIMLSVLAFADKEASNNDFVGLAYGLALVVVAVMHQRAMRVDPADAAWMAHRRNRLVVAAVLASTMTVLPRRARQRGRRGHDPPAPGAHRHREAPGGQPTGRRAPPRGARRAVDAHHVRRGLREGRARRVGGLHRPHRRHRPSWSSSSSCSRSSSCTSTTSPRPGSGPGMMRAELWTLVHLPLQIGIVTVAVGISKYIEIDETAVDRKVIVILSAGFVLVYSGLAVLGALGERRPIVPLTVARVGFALVVVALGAGAWFYDWFTPSGLLIAFAGLAAAHVALAWRLRDDTSVPVRPLGSARRPEEEQGEL